MRLGAEHSKIQHHVTFSSTPLFCFEERETLPEAQSHEHRTIAHVEVLNDL